ncbi:MAG: response regulator [Bacteroidales bacterium]|nr:response regulator [Bacteroidales bacterium]
MRSKILWLLLVACLFPVFGQDNYFLFHQLTLEHGLSNNSVTCIFKDSRGFVWIGTIDGLNRYDGYSFVTYRHSNIDTNSISDNFISTIVEDKEGNLWIGTQGGGLNCYDPRLERFQVFVHEPGNYNSLPSNFIFHHSSMHFDKQGNLWIGTNNGLSCYNLALKKFIHFTLKPPGNRSEAAKDIRTIFQANDGSLWIGTNKGIYQYDPVTKRILNYLNAETGTQKLTNNIITAVVENTLHGELWIGTEEGLNVLNLKSLSIKHYYANKNDQSSLSDNSITALDIDEKGNIWIGTKSGGLNQYSYTEKRFFSWKQNPVDKNSLSDNYIDNLYVDKSGYLWIGTVNNGINLVDIRPKKFRWIKNEPGNPNSLSSNTIRSVFEDSQGILWIGTYGGGLNRYDGRNFMHFYHQPNNNNSLSHNIISALYESDNTLWIGTWGGGVCKMNTKNFKITRLNLNLPDYVNQITVDNYGRLWIACNGGLYVYKSPTSTIIRIDDDSLVSRRLTANSVNRIHWDKRGNMWVATFDGLNCIVFKDFEKLIIDTIYHFRKQINRPNSLNDNRILTIERDLLDNIYLGTYTGGINKMIVKWENNRISEVKFTPYTDNEGLAGNIVYGILSDNRGNLWISTNNGLSKFNPTDNSFQNFTIDDGLQSNQFYWNAYGKGRNSRMFFGGINGLNLFYPDSIQIQRNFPQIYITNFQLFNQPVRVSFEKKALLKQSILYTHSIVLRRHEYPFTIEFAALVFRSQNKIRYAYRLENFDHTWLYTDATRRYATYSHLRPGKYIFKVKATNEDGVWSNSTAELHITILPAFYETFWAFMVYGLVLLALLYFFRRQVLARARYRHEIQLQRMERKKSEEYNEMKLQFFTNISHEFRTPLTLILGPLEKILSHSDLDKNIREQLLLMRSGSKRLLHLINQLLEFRKVESGSYELKIIRKDVIPAIKEIVELFKSTAQSHNILYTVSIPLKSVVLCIDENVLETVAFNLLSNAFKFTPSGGKVHFEVEFFNIELQKTLLENEIYYLSIKVSDTGRGIPPEKQEDIFKRFYQLPFPTNNATKGTGIGLTLCKELCTLHGGDIKVESIVDKGSTFIATLTVHPAFFTLKNIPILAIDEGQKKPIIENGEKFAFILQDQDRLEFEPPSNPESPRVLIIEDDVEIIKFIGKLIEQHYHISYALNGADGLKLALDQEPDIIISDIMMPRMSGFELCEKIKTDPRLSHIPVILLTALSNIDDKIKGYHLGADEYLTKPFDQRHLLVRIEKLIEQRNQLRRHFQQQFSIESELPTLSPLDQQLIQKVIQLIEEKIADPSLSVEDLSHHIGISTTHLYRKIKALTGLSTNDLIRKIRLKKAAMLLLQGQGNVSQVMYEVGFNNSSYFARRFQEEFGMTPSEYIQKNKK